MKKKMSAEHNSGPSVVIYILALSITLQTSKSFQIAIYPRTMLYVALT